MTPAPAVAWSPFHPVPLQQTPTTPAGATGVISRILAGLGIPYADPLGDAVTFLAALVVVYVVGRAILTPVIERVLDARNLDEHARVPLRKLSRALVIVGALGVALALAGWGDVLTSLATIAAAGTLAVGFAMQDVIKNFTAGVFIFTDEPFRIGDWIEWDGHEGVVEDISLRVTRVRTFDNELLTVPNSHLTDGVIKNPVAKERLRLKFSFGVGYEDDVEEASRLIVSAAEEHPDILDEPAPSVRLVELSDSSVALQGRIWIADPSRSDFVRIRSEWVADAKQRLEAAGIDIPFPQRELSGGLALTDGPDAAALGVEPGED